MPPSDPPALAAERRANVGPLEWLSPALLGGLAGAAVPVLIHLIQRKHAPEHAFPAYELLLAGARRASPQVRLRHFLVMLLRVFAVLLFAAALALPALHTAAAGALSDSPVACLILLDDTMSMQYRNNSQSLYERAQTQAADMLGCLRQFDRAAVMTFSGRRLYSAAFTADFAALRSALHDTPAGWGAYPAESALKNAVSELKEQKQEDKILLVLSDFTRSSWNEEDLSILAAAPVRVDAPDLWEGVAPVNRSIESVAIVAKGDAVSATVSVSAMGVKLPLNVPCTLRLDGGPKASAIAPLDANGRGEAALSVTPPRGWFSGQVSIPSDTLTPDDVRYVCGRARGPARVLIVDGDPRESMHKSESYYLDLALRSAGPESELDCRIVAHQEFTMADVSSCDCVVLANVPADSLGDISKLESFVKSGGGLWILPGDRTDAQQYNKALSLLMPALLEEVVTADTAGHTEHISAEGLTHAVFHPLDGQWLLRFGDASFRCWWRLRPERGAHVLARFTGGGPAIVEGALGRGRVILMAGPLDRDWSDLCIQPVFVPLVHQTVHYLARILAQGQPLDLKVGDTYRMPLQQRADALYVRTPSGLWHEEKLLQGEGDSPQLVFADTHTPGVYVVATEPDMSAATAMFSVNVDPRESDLRRLDRAVIARALAGGAEKTQRRPGGLVRLWPTLLWMALGALVAESILARK
jgi:hypothetical protein